MYVNFRPSAKMRRRQINVVLEVRVLTKIKNK